MKSPFHKLLAAGIAALGFAQARAEAPIEVMVLGTYHFANPGKDLHNAKMDDVLSPKRQKEVAAVVDGLAAFRPTLVAVEANADSLPGRALPGFREYVAGTEPPSRNEIRQIGFRLARQMKHDRVIGIDAPGEFPFEDVQAFAAAHGRADALQRSIDAMGRRTSEFETRAKKATVGSLLRLMNEPARVREDHAWYMRTLTYGAGSEQPGARLVGSWSARNIAICARLHQAVKPGERVVVVYGAGHAHLLRQCVLDTPGWKLVEPNAYLPR